MTNIKKLLFLLSLLTLASCDSPKELTKKLDTHEVASPIVKDISENNEYVAQI